jgi:hypothetical protein
MCNSPLYNSRINTARRSLTLQRRMAKGIARNIQVDFISSFGFPRCFIRSIQILVTRSGIKKEKEEKKKKKNKNKNLGYRKFYSADCHQ